MPITVPGQAIFTLLTVQTEPVPAWIAVAGLLVLTAVVLAYSCLPIRRLDPLHHRLACRSQDNLACENTSNPCCHA